MNGVVAGKKSIGKSVTNFCSEKGKGGGRGGKTEINCYFHFSIGGGEKRGESPTRNNPKEINPLWFTKGGGKEKLPYESQILSEKC